MSVYIQNIQCQVPHTSYSQTFLMDKLKQRLKGSKRTNRLIDRIYKESGIDKRHSVITDLDAFYNNSHEDTHTSPTTKCRNDLFAKAGRRMFIELGQKAIDGCDNVSYRDITHLIVVSCTGFFNPGPDYEIINALGLNKAVQRYNIGFMGCYGAFPALRLAHAICQADPNAAVLIVAVELCTLHAQLKEDLDSILGTAIFADGGAAVVVSTKAPLPRQEVFQMEHFESTIIADSEADMAWTIGDTGFEMVLSQYVPKIIESNIGEIITPILNRRGMTITDIDHWAVHPGGKAILDKIESALELGDRLEASRFVLRQYGNMSSVTILFVLKEILRQRSSRLNESVVSMAFGPGLTVEVGFLKKHTTETIYEKRVELSTTNQAYTHDKKLTCTP
jgi:predicted naringenin-chalcone synthase